MSDYFDHVEQEGRAALERGAHRPWYARLVRRAQGMGRRSRGLAVVLAALVIATPAVGAVSNWFGLGAPQHFAGHSPGQGIGTAQPGTSELTALRVPDPHGGPPWGLRIVRTTRGDTCVQIGRVENGRLGSLGLDGAWHDDHLFHPFPDTSETPDCGTTDAAGQAFVNSDNTGQVANGQPVGNRAPGCSAQGGGGRLLCASGAVRIVFMGLLGPDAKSIAYKTPDGALRTEQTVGDDGAYLLVFTESAKTCGLYTGNRFVGHYGPCPGASQGDSPSLNSIGAIKKVTYRDGHVCNLVVTANNRNAACPPVGYVAFNEKRLTSADVATPIKVRTVTGRRPDVILADVSFTARQPVTSSRSSYNYVIKYPSGCRGSGGGGPIARGNVSRGAELRFQSYAAVANDCHGIYRGTIVYVENNGPSTSREVPPVYYLSQHTFNGPSGIRVLTVGHFNYKVP